MQTILFVSTEPPASYPDIGPHYTWVPVHGALDFARLSDIWHTHAPLAVYTYGPHDAWPALSVTYEVRKRWVHLDTLPATLHVATNVFTAALGKGQPLMSIITTTFRSEHKILRPFRSLQRQTHTHWEWIIWDDSDDDGRTYAQLLELQRQDLRIHVYRAPRHSGRIGQMKRRAAGQATGDFIVEVDHDDDLHPELLQWIRDAATVHPSAQFFYTDCCELTEETYNSVDYGDFFGFGYAIHERIWSPFHGRWITSAVAPAPNPTTLTHLVGLPNHVRVWRTAYYDAIGKHNSCLSVADDYDLLVRTWLGGAPWCHIRACGYYQYRNRDGNFTFIRNALIQHMVAQIRHHYRERLPPTDPAAAQKQFWRYEEDVYPPTDRYLTYEPHPRPRTIVLLSPDADTVTDTLRRDTEAAVIILGPDTAALLDSIPPVDRPRIQQWNLNATDDELLRYARRMAHSLSVTTAA